ncbi:hypothetical protein ACFZCY_14060 [Streptomyces sp. NPDC007983]|uniref:hypothetical protein n=1 Tax=Streptomyces sp. NPDC007983 TaxID=3364800 RepID=UPI0036E696B8
MSAVGATRSRNARRATWSVQGVSAACRSPRSAAKAQATASTWGTSRSWPKSRAAEVAGVVAAEARTARPRPVRVVTASTHTGGAMNRPTTSSARPGRDQARRGPAVAPAPGWTR